jgi:hypothetical protein
VNNSEISDLQSKVKKINAAIKTMHDQLEDLKVITLTIADVQMGNICKEDAQQKIKNIRGAN